MSCVRSLSGGMALLMEDGWCGQIAGPSALISFTRTGETVSDARAAMEAYHAERMVCVRYLVGEDEGVVYQKLLGELGARAGLGKQILPTVVAPNLHPVATPLACSPIL